MCRGFSCGSVVNSSQCRKYGFTLEEETATYSSILAWKIPRGFLDGSAGKEYACNTGDAGDVSSIPGLGRSPWRRKWQPAPVFLPREFHGQRSLVGYSPWVATHYAWLRMHTYIHHVVYSRCFPEKEHQLTESSNVPKLSCSCIVTLILLIQNPYFTFIYTLYFFIVINGALGFKWKSSTFYRKKRWEYGSVQFSCSVISDSLWSHGLQYARLPCPLPITGACSNSCPLSC